ncbi:cytochrome c [Marinobacterium sp. D7]|uniref:c-type cytochrome n=1 Tax=Marinobacterium ramblicola TaxID=2849041 RepID=UPI001C2CF15A|nr:cytochrome c [Marinobacterium ramblicola]MBV1788066.1 cytochrome c [Marinobacterium ramblicola]
MKSTLVMGAVLTLSASLASGVVMAHGGASGIVKERMESMKEMKRSMKSMSAIFSGKSAYDAEVVKKAAQVIETKSGEAMTKLFPEGSVHGPSEAKPEIWQEWDRFQSLAEQLKRYSRALEKAADNGMASGNAQGSMMGNSSMMGSGTMSSMMGDQGPSEEHLAEMPADAVFQMLTDTCSSCHTRYRVEE